MLIRKSIKKEKMDTLRNNYSGTREISKNLHWYLPKGKRKVNIRFLSPSELFKKLLLDLANYSVERLPTTARKSGIESIETYYNVLELV